MDASEGRFEPDRSLAEPHPLSGAIRESGLVDAADRGVILLSGGPDSVGLTAALASVLGPRRLVAVHLNYGLRPDSGSDQAICERLCRRLGLELTVEQPPGREGNLHDWARRARYAAAERIRAGCGADWIAVGHTGTDLAETVIYRLAASPGVRPLMAMRSRSDRVIRPLLALSRSEVRRAVEEAGLEFTDDPSNEDRSFARARIRNEILPVLRGINPAVEANIASTREELSEDSRLLEEMAARVLDQAPAGSGPPPPSSGPPQPDPASTGAVRPIVPIAVLEDLDPALQRRVIRILAERTLGRPVPVPRDLAERILRLGRAPEGGQADLGGGAKVNIERGRIHVVPAADGEPADQAKTGDPSALVAAPVAVEVPGTAAWGDWIVRTESTEPDAPGPDEPGAFDQVPTGPFEAVVDRSPLGERILVRGWQQGDRIQPLGMKGSKSLQDLFTDRGIPRSQRRALPVVMAGDEVVWVAGVALSHRFRIRPDTGSAVRISARHAKGADRG